MTGNVFNIQRFCTHDGPGIRTVVFLKGCPLRCAWCHNPESQSAHTQILFDGDKCIGCSSCARLCTNGANIWQDGEHIYHRDVCNLCLACVNACPSGALELCGKGVSTQEVIEALLRDKDFYEESGGGITLSGGEPLMQYEFCLEVLQMAKKENLHTAIETSGYCQKSLDEIRKYIDLWLYDIKLATEEEHLKYTGVSNSVITQNLCRLDFLGAQIILRCPIIPEVNLNKDHFDFIAELANSLNSVIGIQFAPYHPLGIEKAKKLGKAQAYTSSEFLPKEELIPFVDKVRKNVQCKVEFV